MTEKKPRKSAVETKAEPALKYMVMEDAEDVSRALFKEKKVDFFATHCADCPYQGTYLYFLSKNTADIISNLLGWKKFYACGAKKYFCIKVKGALNEVLQGLAEKADLQEIKE